MSIGKAIPVWYSDEDRRRVEEAAALAGYKHLSKYIRDKSLGRDGQHQAVQDSLQAWADRQELISRLAETERSQRVAHALLAMLLFLVQRKATAAEVHALLCACENASVATDLLDTMPQLAELLRRFTEDP